MNYSSYRISLNNHDTSSQITLNAKQGDTGRKIYVSFTEGGIPYEIEDGCRAVFTAEKPDGNLIYNDCVIEGNVVVYTITAQTTAMVGFVSCEIKLYDAEDILLISPRFGLLVEEPVFNDQNIPGSGPEFNAIKDIVDNTVMKYMEENPVATDGTLSKTGWAADAKVTGEKIKALESNKLDNSGGDVTGPISMTEHRITNLAEPVEKTDAVTKRYADSIKTTAENALARSGGKMTGALEVLAPTAGTHPATKDYVDNIETFEAVKLAAGSWSGNTITVPASKVTADTAKCHVTVSPSPEEANFLAYCESGTRCLSQGDGKLTFVCSEKPEMDLQVNLCVRRIGE